MTKHIPLDIAMQGDKVETAVAQISYIGRMTTSVEIGHGMPGAPFSTFEDARRMVIVAGASGGASANFLIPAALNKFAGAKFKIVTGYGGTIEVILAAERGEVQYVPATGLERRKAWPISMMSCGVTSMFIIDPDDISDALGEIYFLIRAEIWSRSRRGVLAVSRAISSRVSPGAGSMMSLRSAILALNSGSATMSRKDLRSAAKRSFGTPVGEFNARPISPELAIRRSIDLLSSSSPSSPIAGTCGMSGCRLKAA